MSKTRGRRYSGSVTRKVTVEIMQGCPLSPAWTWRGRRLVNDVDPVGGVYALNNYDCCESIPDTHDKNVISLYVSPEVGAHEYAPQ